MAPPLKRRRLFFWDAEETESKPAFSHIVDELEVQTISPEDALLAQYKRDLEERQVENVVVVVQADVVVSVEASVTAGPTAATIASSSAAPESTPAPASSTVLSTSISLPQSSLTSVLPGSSVTPIISSSTSIESISSTPITSAVPSSSKKLVAGDILNSNLTTSIPSSSFRSSSIFVTGYSNSSISLNATASFSSSFEASSTVDDSQTTSGVVVITTTGSDGQPSTYTTRVGATAFGTTTAPGADATVVAGSGSSPPSPPAGTIAGGVVGGAAGLAVLLLVAMLFLRWYRQRSQRERQALLPASFSDTDLVGPSSRPGMAESAGIRPLMLAVPGMFRHQPSKSLAVQRGLSVNNERGFQRLSGRKLPSAFSPGMEYGQMPPIPGPYRDVHELPAGRFTPPEERESTSPGESTLLGRQASDERMTMLPGPQRRPTLHNNANLQIPGTPRHVRHVSSSARTSGIIQ